MIVLYLGFQTQLNNRLYSYYEWIVLFVPVATNLFKLMTAGGSVNTELINYFK